MRRVNRVLTNPVMGTFAWLAPPLAVVHHVGRKSGRHYHTPVVAFSGRTEFVIPIPYGRDVEWARNVVAASECGLVQMGRRLRLYNPRIVGFRAAEPHLPAIARGALRAANLPRYVLLARESGRSRPGGTRSRHTASASASS
ncbi:MAG TPA: nitroreductase family deazaflavin-dependent oxidoreductase [Myxococcota bacterium]|nr:nitroreductase family deazaflavin-dependent oxidoreductase [Myxococcota bacterium]